VLEYFNLPDAGGIVAGPEPDADHHARPDRDPCIPYRAVHVAIRDRSFDTRSYGRPQPRPDSWPDTFVVRVLGDPHRRGR